MIGWIIGAVVAAFVVTGMLLSESGGSSNYRRSGVGDVTRSAMGALLMVVVLVLLWGGWIADFEGCVCIVLKVLSVEPVGSWTWFEAFLPLIGGVVAQITGYILAEAVK